MQSSTSNFASSWHQWTALGEKPHPIWFSWSILSWSHTSLCFLYKRLNALDRVGSTKQTKHMDSRVHDPQKDLFLRSGFFRRPRHGTLFPGVAEGFFSRLLKQVQGFLPSAGDNQNSPYFTCPSARPGVSVPLRPALLRSPHSPARHQPRTDGARTQVLLILDEATETSGPATPFTRSPRLAGAKKRLRWRCPVFWGCFCWIPADSLARRVFRFIELRPTRGPLRMVFPSKKVFPCRKSFSVYFAWILFCWHRDPTICAARISSIPTNAARVAFVLVGRLGPGFRMQDLVRVRRAAWAMGTTRRDMARTDHGTVSA